MNRVLRAVIQDCTVKVLLDEELDCAGCVRVKARTVYLNRRPLLKSLKVLCHELVHLAARDLFDDKATCKQIDTAIDFLGSVFSRYEEYESLGSKDIEEALSTLSYYNEVLRETVRSYFTQKRNQQLIARVYTLTISRQLKPKGGEGK